MTKRTFLTICIMGMVVLNGAGCSSSSNSTTEPTVENAAATEAAIVKAPETTTETPKATTEATASLTLGETGTIGNWSVTVTGSETTKRVDEDMMYFEASEGNQYVMIDATVENTGKQAASFLSMVTLDGDPDAKLIYGDGYEYKPTGLMGSEKELQDTPVNPLEKKDGRITFEVPDTVVESNEPLTLTITNGTDTLSYAIR